MKEAHEKKNKKKGETKEVDFDKIYDANSELDMLRKELEEKTKVADDYLSRLKYLQADFENYKKMEAREKKTYEMNATELLIKNLLPIIDSFEIAIELVKKNYNKASFINGIELIYSDFLSELGKEGLKQIKAVGKKFDPYYNEVTMTVINNNLPEDTVVEEHERGYMLGSKVIRTSKVKVSKIENQLDEK
ncbi:nucleotide exchange factor GrpE [Thermoplasmatota archaeon]